MQTRQTTLRKSILAAQGTENDLRHATPEECLNMMWQLALDAWAFKGEPVAEPKLSRHVIRIIRGKR